ncbi:tensin-4-like isoform X2 [Megalops cyprinoides]|uniref:tensin-4-like isoform X2 n=1 Tax=Megalops cyprinoides TaxID=118141 RepID=UPI001863E4AB|nr:tensin-4-like isoform X2 [Megalops cyprinoides]
MRPTSEAMSQVMHTHVLRVGQSVHLGSTEEVLPLGHSLPPSAHSISCSLDISLDNLNQLILELDPTFQPLQSSAHREQNFSRSCTDPSADDDLSQAVLEPRGCSPQTRCGTSTSATPSSRSMPIPMRSGSSCSPHGSLVFSGSPSSSRPPLPIGSHRVSLSQRCDSPVSCSPVSLPVVRGHRASATSLISTSPGSDTSYILGSCHSLFSDEADSPERLLYGSSGSFSHVISPNPQSPGPNKPFFSETNIDQSLPTLPASLHHSRGIIPPSYPSSCPPSVAGSLSDIPVVLINGAPEPKPSPRPSQEWPSGGGVGGLNRQTLRRTCTGSTPSSPQGSQASMKLVMDSSQFWFRPHITRDEADALLRDQEPGSFVVRDSSSYRGSFGLAMKVQEVLTNLTSTCHSGEGVPEPVRHYLIESTAKGVRLKGSSEEPYFGSLSALVHQHTITPYALPCKLKIPSHDFSSRLEKGQDMSVTPELTKAACNFLYLSSVATEMLTGPCAIQRAVSEIFKKEAVSSPTVVNLKVSRNGVTLTDIQRKLFFRRHYPVQLLSYCGEDPENRMWKRNCKSASRIFGFVAKGMEAGVENMCHVFAEYDALQPASLAIQLVQGIVADGNKQK